MQEANDMRICIPTQDDRERDAIASEHFGSAPFYTIYDSEMKSYHTVNNADRGHHHGSCSPMKVLHQENINVALCRGLGQRALQKLQEAGIRIFQSLEANVQANIESFLRNELTEFTMENSCHTHNCHS